jgi:DNA-binding LytR/AlgR family response regulator
VTDLVLVEDEPPALEKLAAGVRAWDPECRIVATLSRVDETIRWLREHRAPDLLLMDIQLADGRSLDVLRAVEVTCPVVVVTAYDEFVLEALALNCIDYLLKPVRQERLAQALDKYVRLREHFRGDLAGLARDLEQPARAPRDRVLARKGPDFVAVPVAEVAYFFTEYKLVFLRDRQGTQFLVDRTLEKLEAELDAARFFRLNRKYLAQVSAVRRFRPAEKGRLAVVLAPEPAEPVLVSQERAGAFRKWMGS